jgi:hypothetical protein
MRGRSALDRPPFAAELIVFGVAVVVVLPALGLLYVLNQRGMQGAYNRSAFPIS